METVAGPSPSPLSSSSSHACKRCSTRKIKCSKEKPKCAQCVRFNAECVPVEIDEGRKRKARFPEATLISKIRRYEGKLRELGVDPIDMADDDDGDGRALSGSHDAEAAPALRAKEEREAVENILELTTARPKSSRGAIFDTFDRMYPDDGSSRLFEPPAPWQEVPTHPSAFEIWSLWQAYLDHVDPVIKIIHTPTVHRKLLAAGSKLNDAPDEVQAADHLLFFAIYRFAMTASADVMPAGSSSCTQESIEAGFRYWLRRADGWRTADPQVIQALVLYVSAIFRLLDPRVIGLIMGVVVRSACRLHLHLQFEAGLEAEYQRRIWWEITTLDTRSQEIAGLDLVLLARNVQLQVPNALSDAALEEEAGSSSSVPARPSTDALLPFLRALCADWAQRVRGEQQRHGPQAMGMFELSTPIWTLAEKMTRIDTLERRMEDEVFKHCGSDALSRLILGFGRSLLAKTRMLAVLGEESLQARRNTERRGQTHSIEDLRHKMIELSVRCLTHYSQLLGDADVRKRFGWFIVRHVPAIPMIHLFRLLQTHTTGPLVDDAWALLHKTDGMGRSHKHFDAQYKGQPMHWLPRTATPVLGDSTFLKAWQARKRAIGGDKVEPQYIQDVRTRLGQLEGGGGGAPAPLNLGYDPTPPSADLDEDWEAWLRQLLGSSV